MSDFETMPIGTQKELETLRAYIAELESNIPESFFQSSPRLMELREKCGGNPKSKSIFNCKTVQRGGRISRGPANW